MSKIIKNFSEFESTNEEFSFGSIIGGLGLGDVAADLIKGKVIEYLYGYLGVTPESVLGTVITNLVETIDFAEYWDIITGGGYMPADKLAPKLADATIETFTELGIDGITGKMSANLDKSGLVYRAFKEMISNQTRKADFRENLISMWTWILTSGASSGSQSSKKDAFSFTKAEAKKIADDPAVKQEMKNSGASNSDVTDMLKSLTGGMPNFGKVGNEKG
jgi:hypothetical protein